MKKYLILIIAACSLFVAQSCKEVSNQMDPDYPADYDVNYALREVLEIDPVNVNGIDVMPYFDFFNDFRFVIHYRDGKISSCEMSNGDVPFSPPSEALSSAAARPALVLSISAVFFPACVMSSVLLAFTTTLCGSS